MQCLAEALSHPWAIWGNKWEVRRDRRLRRLLLWPLTLAGLQILGHDAQSAQGRTPHPDRAYINRLITKITVLPLKPIGQLPSFGPQLCHDNLRS